MEEIELLKHRIEREQKARKQAEEILERKSLELYKANEQLRNLNENLESQIKIGITKLQKTEQLYQELIESVQDIIYKISPEGYFTFVNKVVEQRLGYSEKEIIGLHFTQLVLPEYRETLLEFYKNMILQKRESTYHEFPVSAKDGTTVWIGQTVRLIESENNNIELVAVARDITDHKATEDSLRTTQTRLSTLITNLQKGVLVEDENRKIILVNQLFCEIFNISTPIESLIGFDCSQSAEETKHLFHNPEQFVQRIDEILTQKVITVEENLNMIDGRVLQRDYIPIFLEGHYRGHLWEYADITEQHRSQEIIRKSEEKYRGIMNNMELGLLEVDNNQVIIRAYDRFCKMIGYTEEELVGKVAPDLFVAKEFNDTLDSHQKQRSKGHASSYELQLVRKDGSKLWTIVSGAPIIDENGEVVGSLGIHYDITERKSLEQELELAKQIAEDARQAEKQFLANMSHEIRTPLNAIIGMTHLLFDTRPNKQQYEYLDILKTSADFLLSLISDLLDMAKIEAGRIEVQKQPFDLVGLLRTTQRVFQIRLENRPIELNLMIDARISGSYVGDELILNQILMNLIGNSEKFTEEGSIDIAVKQKKQEDDITWIEFKIIDTGSGIPEEKLDLIFQKFKQVNAQGHKHKGTGLGLAITKQLIEVQEGTISVKSEEGEGTTFTFTLPFQKSDSEIALNTHEINYAPSSVEGCKILVAEDNIMNQKYISSLLTKWNINFIIANDGRKAIEQAQKQLFDIILMDIQMPNTDGYEATISIRNTKNPNQHTPIIALTASAMLDQKSKALTVGMNDFITKPFAPNHLLNTLRIYINSSKLAANSVIEIESDNDTESPIDRIRLKELYGDDKEYATEMFQTFLNDVLPDFQFMNNLLAQKEWVKMGTLTHKLKPTLGMVGLCDLEIQMQTLEKILKEESDMSQVQSLWENIQHGLNESIPLLEQELDKLMK
ncbi:Sensor histidine kinase RcsC [Emticicia aquatica]|uniref:histidine kinase n=1 Tax=Emticicia aquatica TaxID=1681835 RepID=A0ABN8EW55_9BACT|nr:PAS domain S-box protein [Emticicia aquatica]CAH0995973.1 Sensor histidine kinase RcsC [Emticicia aquatica]